MFVKKISRCWHVMVLAILVSVVLLPQSSEGQLLKAIRDFFKPVGNLFATRPITPRPKFKDDGTQKPRSTGIEQLFPTDCGRDPQKGTGKLCFPDGILCQQSKLGLLMPPFSK